MSVLSLVGRYQFVTPSERSERGTKYDIVTRGSHRSDAILVLTAGQKRYHSNKKRYQTISDNIVWHSTLDWTQNWTHPKIYIFPDKNNPENINQRVLFYKQKTSPFLDLSV